MLKNYTAGVIFLQFPENIDIQPDQAVEPGDDFGMVNTGSLVVFVLDAGGALPIPGAKVTIYNAGEINGQPVAELISGENGKTEPLYVRTLQVPITDIPQQRTNMISLYDVVVKLPGYYTVISRNIPVYPQVMSVQPIYMVPMTGIEPPGRLIIGPHDDDQ